MSEKGFKISVLIGFVGVIAALGYVISMSSQQMDIAYVKSGVILAEYAGTKESLKSYQIQVNKWQSEVDSMMTAYEMDVARLQTMSSTMSEEEKYSLEQKVNAQYNVIGRFTTDIEKKGQAAADKIEEQSLNQINQFINQYAVEHDIDVIFGSNQQGNILYGEDSKDITDELLLALNQHHSGK